MLELFALGITTLFVLGFVAKIAMDKYCYEISLETIAIGTWIFLSVMILTGYWVIMDKSAEFNTKMEAKLVEKHERMWRVLEGKGKDAEYDAMVEAHSERIMDNIFDTYGTLSPQ